MAANLRLLLLRLRHSSASIPLKYLAFLIYTFFVLAIIGYLVKSTTETVLVPDGRDEDVPKEIKDFENLARFGLGAHGSGANLHDEQSLEEVNNQMKLYSYNKYVSDRITLRRSLPDTRHRQCRHIDYGPLNRLPKASVIIIFCNETFSALMRTVWSVIDESPSELLHEIVLIDDGSGSDEITKLLPMYLKWRMSGYNIHLHRNEKQTGLISARLAGAKKASGDIIIFLDSHCEATKGWLEPLAYHIKHHPKAVAIPSIDSIDSKTLEFHGSPGGIGISVGGFTWSGHFTWEIYKHAPPNRRASDPAPTPTMAGGLFAMDRKLFWDLGGYDEGMIGWGGENLELSFRVWQCGGRMDSIPCSHVGHIFRDTHPYFIPEDSHGKNTVRMAEVWMDDYKRLFYIHRTELKSQIGFKTSQVQARLELRDRLKCKPFSWYLKNVIPHKFIMDEDSIKYGRVRNGANNRICVDHLQRDQGHHLSSYTLGQYLCHGFLGSSQYFSYSKKQEFRNEYMCAEASSRSESKVTMHPCHGGDNQKWDYINGQLKNRESGKCMGSPKVPANEANSQELIASECNGSQHQKWIFEF